MLKGNSLLDRYTKTPSGAASAAKARRGQRGPPGLDPPPPLKAHKAQVPAPPGGGQAAPASGLLHPETGCWGQSLEGQAGQALTSPVPPPPPPHPPKLSPGPPCQASRVCSCRPSPQSCFLSSLGGALGREASILLHWSFPSCLQKAVLLSP